MSSVVYWRLLRLRHCSLLAPDKKTTPTMNNEHVINVLFHHTFKCFLIWGGRLDCNIIHRAGPELTSSIWSDINLLEDRPPKYYTRELEGTRNIGVIRDYFYILQCHNHFIDSCDVYICVLPAPFLNWIPGYKDHKERRSQQYDLPRCG